jgi:ABC-type nitrate/sulfonate/bicarbonate transport system substrate-binding protein
MNLLSSIGRRAFVAALACAACAAAAQQPRAITIVTSSASIPAGAARIAKELGLFDKYGLQAKVTPADTGSVASAALISGAVDFVTTGPSDVVSAQGMGQKVVALTAGYRGFAATLVLSKAAVEKVKVSPTAPVAARLKALDGLTIATTSASSTFAVGPKSAVEGVGAKMNFTYMAQPAMVAALKRGVIDGFIASAPFYLQPIIDGSGVIWIQGSKGEWPPKSAPVNSVVVIVKRDFADANPELMKRVTSVFMDLWKAMDERPADVKAAMAKLWPDLDAKTLDLVFESEAGGFKAKPVTVEDMAQEIAFMKLGGVNLPQMDRLNPAEMIYP